MSERTFTYEEAESLLPVLEVLLRRAVADKARLESVEGELKRLAERVFLSGGLLLDAQWAASRKQQKQRLSQSLRDALAEIQAAGVQVKDLDVGLLDFPCQVEGEVILLCWKLGEKKIGYWHGMEEGYRGRKPVDDRILRIRQSRQSS